MGSGHSRRRAMQTPVEITGQQGEKGMLNSLGLHHCFLNVTIQSLWHLDSFRERFSRLPHHEHKQKGLVHDYVGIDGGEEKAHAAAAAAADDMVDVTHADAEEEEDGEISTVPMDSTSTELPAAEPPSPDLSRIMDDPSCCVCCALQTVFINYQHSDSSIIPPDTLRFALSLLLDNRGGGSKFALKEMSDAEEALEEILRYLHWDHVGAAAVPATPAAKPGASVESELSRSLDVTCTPECISHRCFGTSLMDQKVCTKCSANSDPELSTCFLYRIYVTEIVRTRRAHKDWSLEAILKSNYLTQDYSCPEPNKSRRGPQGQAVPSQCSGPAKIERWVLSLPEVFTMMCAWSDAETERQEIQEFFGMIPQRLHLDRFLRVQSAASPSAANGDASLTYQYTLKGFVLYYGRHYVSIFWSAQFQSYVMFDDRRVTRIGDWNAVVDRCCRGKLQPTVLFYESADPLVKARLKREMQLADQREQTRQSEERDVTMVAQASMSSHQPQAAPTPAVASASSAMASPTTAATHSYFGTSGAASHAHIIPVPSSVLSPPPTGHPGPPPPPRPVRTAPAIIPDYIPSGSAGPSSSSSATADVSEWDRWFSGAGSGDPSQAGGASSSYAAVTPPTGRVGGPPHHWICLGCRQMHSATNAPHGQCPACLHPTAQPHQRR